MPQEESSMMFRKIDLMMKLTSLTTLLAHLKLKVFIMVEVFIFTR